MRCSSPFSFPATAIFSGWTFSAQSVISVFCSGPGLLDRYPILPLRLFTDPCRSWLLFLLSPAPKLIQAPQVPRVFNPRGRDEERVLRCDVPRGDCFQIKWELTGPCPSRCFALAARPPPPARRYSFRLQVRYREPSGKVAPLSFFQLSSG